MYPHYSYLESVNKIVDGNVIRGSVTTVKEDDMIQSVAYVDGTTENFTLHDLNERAVYHEAGYDRFLFFNNRANCAYGRKTSTSSMTTPQWWSGGSKASNKTWT